VNWEDVEVSQFPVPPGILWQFEPCVVERCLDGGW